MMLAGRVYACLSIKAFSVPLTLSQQHQQLSSLDSCSSIVSLRSKRKGRVFSDEEACSIASKSKRAKLDTENNFAHVAVLNT
jgi:hypothetical protein